MQNKEILNKFKEMYNRLLKEKVDTSGYVFIVSIDIMREIIKSEYMCKFHRKNYIFHYNDLPIHSDRSLLDGTVVLYKKFI